MEVWQAIIVLWAAAAYIDRRSEIVNCFSDETTYPIYERVFFTLVWLVIGLVWPYPRIFLPLANRVIAASRKWGR